jgi:plasmid stabilization system protein ParE
MTDRLSFSSLAEADLAEAIDWYNRLRAGLGETLALCVEDALGRILDNPQAFPCVMASVRRARLRRFPYSVMFRVRKEDIEIVAVLHARRDPTGWQSRIA